MKKFVKILSLMVVCVAMSVLAVACGGNHTHAFDTSSWKSDATKHWHSATCEHTTELGDVDGHKDDNIDGTCDVCGYNGGHTHTFDTVLSYDAENHYFKSTCFHNVVDGKEAHTLNAANVCTVCGYNAGLEAPKTVEDAIELGVAMKSVVKSGYAVRNNGGDWYPMNYVYADGFLYVENYTYGSVNPTYYIQDGEAVYAITESYGIEASIVTEDNLLGPVMPKAFIGGYDYEGDFYGAEDLVATLYEIASQDLNKDFAEYVEDGVYGFTFGYVLQQGADVYLYVINVAFKLSADLGYFEAVVVSSQVYVNNYEYEQVTELILVDENDQPILDENDEQITYYAPIDEVDYAEDYQVMVNQYTTGLDIENPYTPETLKVTGYSLVDENQEEITEAINYEIGTSSVTVYVAECLPETAILSLAEVEITSELPVNPEYDNENGYPEKYVTAVYDSEWGSIRISLFGVENNDVVELTISVNDVEKELTFNVTEPVPTTIMYKQAVFSDMDGWQGVDIENNTVEMYVGKFYFVAETDKINSVQIAVSNDLTAADYINEWEDTETIALTADYMSYTYATVQVIDFTTVGTYKITLTSSKNAELEEVITVNVATPPQVKDIVKGTLNGGVDAVMMKGGFNVTATFTPNAVDSLEGTLSVALTVMPSMMDFYNNGAENENYSAEYTYVANADTGAIAITYVSGNEFEIAFAVNDSYAVAVTYNELTATMIVYTSEVAAIGDWLNEEETITLTLNDDGTGQYLEFSEPGAWMPTAAAWIFWEIAETATADGYAITITLDSWDIEGTTTFSIPGTAYLASDFSSITLTTAIVLSK